MQMTGSSLIFTLSFIESFCLPQVDLGRYFLHTPLHTFYSEDTILTSLWPLSHMSDLLRYVTLYNYGGTYLDLDFVVMK